MEIENKDSTLGQEEQDKGQNELMYDIASGVEEGIKILKKMKEEGNPNYEKEKQRLIDLIESL